MEGGGCSIKAIKQFPLGETDVKRESYIFLLIKTLWDIHSFNHGLSFL